MRARRAAHRYEKRYRNHPRLVPVLAGILVLGLVLIIIFSLRDSVITVNKIDAKIVILYSDHETKTLPTREETVGAFLEKAGVTLNEGDVVEPAADTKIEEDDFRVNVYRASPVVIQDEGKRVVTYSAAQTPRSITDQAGIQVYPEDAVRSEQPVDFLMDGIGQKVVIERSVPVSLNLYGTPLSLRTRSKTVGDLLNEKGVQLAADDQVQPSLDTPLSSLIQVFVTRFGKQLVSEEQTIAAPTERIDDPSLSFGATAVRQQGSPGKKSLTYELDIVNGQEVGRKLIQEVIVVEPVARIIARGTAISIPSDKTGAMNAAGIASSDHAYVNYIVSRESRWNVLAKNASTGAYGLCQALPGSKMATAGSDWETNAVTQLKWCTGYAVGRYGSWEAAYNFWAEHHWW